MRSRSAAAAPRNSGFSLRIEQGTAQLVLGARLFADLFTVDGLQIAFTTLPARLDLSGGVHRFRHLRGTLERVTFTAFDEALDEALARTDRPAQALLTELELRVVGGYIVVAGLLDGAGETAPFVARARLEPATVGGDRSLLLSFFDVRILGPHPIPAPHVASEIIDRVGLAAFKAGPTCALFDPIELLLPEVFAELGWKAPDPSALRLESVSAEGGRLALACGLREQTRSGASSPQVVPPEGRYRQFLADYEAKMLYQPLEELVAAGELRRARAGYERQLELHPGHPFLVKRLLQLLLVDRSAAGEVVELASAHLDLFPGDEDALAALATAHQMKGAHRAATETWQRLGRQAVERGDVIEGAQALCAAANAVEAIEVETAIALLRQALDLRRRLPSALRRLATLQSKAGDVSGALLTLERLLASEQDADRRLTLLGELGALALHQAADAEAAVGYYERALSVARDDTDALIGLADAHSQAGRRLMAVRTLDRAAELVLSRGDNRRAAEVIVRLGDLWRDVEGEVDANASAALRYRQALLLDPAQPGAHLGLGELALAEGDPLGAREHLEGALRIAPDQLPDGFDRASIHLRLGIMMAQDDRDLPSAVAHLQKALGGQLEQASRATDNLELLYRRTGRWADLARLLELTAERASDSSTRARRLAKWAEILSDKLGDQKRALELWQRAAGLKPGDPEVLRGLAGARRRANDPAALAQTLGLLADCLDDPKEIAAVQAERGWLMKTRLNRADEAAEAFILALGCAPDDLDAIEGLADIYREREQLGELVPLLERWASLEREEARACGLALERARILVALERPTEALLAFEEALEFDSNDPDALRGVADLHFEAGRHSEALLAYQQLFVRYEEEGYPEAAVGFLIRVSLTYSVLGDTEGALEALRRGVALDPDDVAVYERAQDVLLAEGDVRGIVEFLELGLRSAIVPATRSFLACRAGRLYWRELRDAEAAIPLLDEAALLRPNDDDLRRIRIEVATASKDWDRLSELLSAQLDAAIDRDRPALLTRLAEMAYGVLGRPDEGVDFLLRALSIAPEYLPALELLGERSFQLGDWSNAIRAYQGLAELSTPGGPRPEDVTRLATAELRAGMVASARARFRALDEQWRGGGGGGGVSESLGPEIVDGLAEACLRLEDAPATAELAERWLKLLGKTPSAAKDRFCRRAARLMEGDPALREASAACWRALLGDHPDDDDARMALRGVEEGDGEGEHEPELEPEPEPDHDHDHDHVHDHDHESIEERGEWLLGQARAAADPVDRTRLWMELAEHRRDVAQDLAGAAEALRQAIESAADDATWAAAAEELEDLLGLEESWQEIAELADQRLERGIGHPADALATKAAMLQLAKRTDEAIEAAEAMYAHDRARSVEVLVRLYEIAGSPAKAQDALLRDIDQLSTADAARRRWRAAELRKDDPAAALTLLEEAAAVIKDERLLEAWLAQSEAADRPDSQIRALRERAARLAPARPIQGVERGDSPGSGAVRASRILLGAAILAQERLGDDALARELLEGALGHWPENVEAMSRLEAVLIRLDDADALAAHLARQCEALIPGVERGRLTLRIARLKRERLGHLDEAREAAESAVEELWGEANETLGEAVTLAMDLAQSVEDWTGFVRHGEVFAGMELTHQNAERVEQLATVYASKLGDEEAALRHLVRLLDVGLCPPDGVALAINLARRREEWETLIVALKEALRTSVKDDDVDAATPLHAELLGTLAKRLLRPDEAKSYLKELAARLDARGKELAPSLRAVLDRLDG